MWCAVIDSVTKRIISLGFGELYPEDGQEVVPLAGPVTVARMTARRPDDTVVALVVYSWKLGDDPREIITTASENVVYYDRITQYPIDVLS